MNDYLSRFLSLICGVLLTVMGASPAYAASSVGHVSYLNGEVQVLRQDEPRPIGLNDPVFATDVVITSDSGRVKISMDEGSVIFVGSKSRISIDEYVIDKGELKSGAFNMLWGKVRFAVSKLKAPGSSFNVKTATATIGVRGTVFTVSVPKPTGVFAVKLPKSYKLPKLKTQVMLLEGAVIAKAIGGLQKTMKPGQIANIPKTGLISVRKIRPDDLKKSDVDVKEFTSGKGTAPGVAAPAAAVSATPKVKGPKGEEPKVQGPKIEAPKGEEPKVQGPKGEAPKVEEAKIRGPKIKGPKGEETKIRGPKVEEPKIRGPKIRGPKIKGPKIKGPKIKGPKIKGPKIKGPKVEAPKVEAPKIEAPKIEAPKIEAPKIEAPKIEAPKIEAPKIEAPKIEAPKIEAPKIEAPKIEAPKIRAPKIRAPKIRAPKIEAPKIRAPKIRAPKIEAPKIEVPKFEEPKFDKPKFDKPD